MEMTRILVVDDNAEIREIVHILLTAEGFLVEEAADGRTALNLVQTHAFDLIILDVMMPGPDGYQTCQGIRASSNAPILFLSAKSQDQDKIHGFSSGSDDYLSKPFSSGELLSRVKALLRRYQIYRGKEALPSPALVLQSLKVQAADRTVTVHGKPVILTDTEYAMLLLLLQNRGKIFSPAALYEQVWNEPFYAGASNTVMVHMRNLRKKIEDDPKRPSILKTVWGKGYCCG